MLAAAAVLALCTCSLHAPRVHEQPPIGPPPESQPVVEGAALVTAGDTNGDGREGVIAGGGFAAPVVFTNPRRRGVRH